jgi:hypothetical protein
MSAPDALAIALWPVSIALLLIAWNFRSKRGVWQAAIGALAYGWLFVLIRVSLIGVDSLWLIADVIVGMMLAGGSCLVGWYVGWDVISSWGRGVLGLFGVALLGFGSQLLVGDFLLPRLTAQGVVETLHVETRGREPAKYVVVINKQEFSATTSLHSTLRVGERVRVEAGRGSNYIYKLERE